MRLGLAFIIALAAAPALAGEPPACVEMDVQLKDAIAKAPDSLALNSLLLTAARKGCAGAVTQLLNAGASRLARDRTGETALAAAAKAGRDAVVETLLAGASPEDSRQNDMPDAHGASPLMLAIHAGHPKTADFLVAAGARLDTIDAAGETALAEAAFAADEDTGLKLLQKGAKADTLDRSGKSPICYAAARGASRLVAALLDAGVDVKARYGHGLTALMWAAGFSDLTPAPKAAETARLLIARGAEVDAADDRGRTALMIAAALNRMETARVLIDAKADRGRRDAGGKTAADLAATPEMRAAVSP